MAGEPTTTETASPEPSISEQASGDPTIIQTLSGETYSTYSETPDEALKRLSRDFLAQKLGNVVRLVYPLRGSHRARSGN